MYSTGAGAYTVIARIPLDWRFTSATAALSCCVCLSRYLSDSKIDARIGLLLGSRRSKNAAPLQYLVVANGNSWFSGQVTIRPHTTRSSAGVRSRGHARISLRAQLGETTASVLTARYLFVVENRFRYAGRLVHGLEHYFLAKLTRWMFEPRPTSNSTGYLCGISTS
jgi:hypothetical protein